MAAFGNILQIFALLAGAASAVLFYATFLNGAHFLRYAHVLRVVQFVCVTGALVLLGYSILADDFSLRYVCTFSERSLPLLYKLGALWVGPEGAMLLCAWLCLPLAMFESWRLRKTYARYHAALNVLLSIFSVALLVIPVFMTNPFTYMKYFPPDGNGLAPALQNPAAFIYPITSIFAYISSLIMFSHVCAALALKDFSEYWLRVSYRWMFAVLCFTVCVIFLNTYFSPDDIFLRSYWDWDISEITSLLPAIACAGFIHSANLYVNKGRMKRLCVLYPFIIFEFVMLAVYFSRTGHIADDSFLGRPLTPEPILFVIILAAVIFLPTYFRVFRVLKDTPAVVVRTKEKIMLMLNTIALATIGLLLFGLTCKFLFPLQNREFLAESEPYYKYVLLFSTVACVLLYIYYVYSAVRRGKTAYGAKISPRVGRLLSHAGVFLIFFGALYSGAFHHETVINTTVKGQFEFDGHNFLVNSVKSLYKDNYLYMLAEISVHKDGTHKATIAPEIRRYNNSPVFNALSESFTSGFSIFSIATVSYNTDTHELSLLVIDHPLASFVPIGIVLLFIGIIYTAATKRFF